MLEREMQELLWRYPEQFLNEPLKQFKWETSSDVGRADLVFEDRHGRLLIIEVKRGKLPRGAIDQLLDYFGMMKQRFPDKPVELMVVANSIPSERRLTCESRDIECREISDKRFREVAAEYDYKFDSELTVSHTPSQTLTSACNQDATGQKDGVLTSDWSFNKAAQSSEHEQDYLSRCDDEGKEFFAALFEAQKAASNQTKITWKHESGFSLHFYFHRIGFAPVVWGFPANSRNGRSIRQRLEFPFDFSLKAGVPEGFVNEFGASLSSLIPFSGGEKRPSIPIAALDSTQRTQIAAMIFSFAAKASTRNIASGRDGLEDTNSLQSPSDRCLSIPEALEKAAQELNTIYGNRIPRQKLIAETLKLGQFNESSIIPSDYCFNRRNEGSRKTPMFLWYPSSTYEYVGRNYVYTGPVIREPRTSGTSLE
jgi:hypothetical protein